jgi:tetratricopeptide (TPR) repeat protein
MVDQKRTGGTAGIPVGGAPELPEGSVVDETAAMSDEPLPLGTDVPTFTADSENPPEGSANRATTHRRGHDGAPRFERGATLGRYIVLEVLGEGGMGTVYAAFDPDLNRKIAIKLLHPRLEDGDAELWRMRLAREAQAMASVSHPNVVPVFDTGSTADGGVFMAMESVEGGTLRQWLDKQKPSFRQVLAMFREAGQGLAAAHRAGIIHRDFKPANILLDADGRPRVTDFGLARAEGAELPVPVRDPDAAVADAADSVTSQPRSSVVTGALSRDLTRAGTVMGTPGYMAPEQYRAEAIDARADIFAFCASLYHALYGERPFAGRNMDELSAAVHAGRVREAPRGTQVPAWVRRILLRGMATDKAARYPTMQELLAALADDPGVRWRRRAMLAGAALALTASIWGYSAAAQRRVRACHTAGAELADIWDAARKQTIERAFLATGRSYAQAAWEDVRRALDDYTTAWVGASANACEATRVRGEQSEAMLDLRNACLAERLDGVRALSDVFAAADGKVVLRATEVVRALEPLASCAAIDSLSVAARLPADPVQRKHVRSLQAKVAEVHAQWKAGHAQLCLPTLRSIDKAVNDTGYGPLLMRWALQVARCDRAGKDPNIWTAEYEKAILLAERFRLDRERAKASTELGSRLGSWGGRSAEGHVWMRRAEAVIERLGGDAKLEASLDVEEAWIYQAEQKVGQAIPLFNRSISRAEAANLGDIELLASAHSGLGMVFSAQGKHEQAVAENREALRLAESVVGRLHPNLAGYLNNLAMAQMDAGHGDAALEPARRALDIYEEEVRSGDRVAASHEIGIAAETLGEVYLRVGRAAEALPHLTRAREIYREANGGEHPDIALCDTELGQASRMLGQRDEAQRYLDEASQIEAKDKDVPAPTTVFTLVEQATLALDRSAAAQALALAERAFEITKTAEIGPRDLATAKLALARALWLARRDAARSRALAEEANGTFAEIRDQPKLDEAGRLLTALR